MTNFSNNPENLEQGNLGSHNDHSHQADALKDNLEGTEKVDEGYLLGLKDTLLSAAQQSQIDTVIGLLDEKSTLEKKDIQVVGGKLYLCGMNLKDGYSKQIDKETALHLIKNSNLHEYSYPDYFQALNNFTQKLVGKKIDFMGVSYEDGYLDTSYVGLLDFLKKLTEHNKEVLDIMWTLIQPKEIRLPFAINADKNSVIYCELLTDQRKFSTYYHVEKIPVIKKLDNYIV